MKTIELKHKEIYNLTQNFLDAICFTFGIDVVWSLLIGPFLTYRSYWVGSCIEVT